MNTKKFIKVTFQKEGIHRYPAAETDPKLKTGSWDDVSFLASSHRHLFHFTVWIEVFHNDRELEFIQEKRWMQRLYDIENILQLDYKSCEMISDDLYGQLNSRYQGKREIWIEVSEDNENGSFIQYFKSGT